MVQVGHLAVKFTVDGKQAFVKDMGDAKKATADVGTEFERVERRGSNSLNSLAATAKRVLPALSIGAVIGAGWNRFTGIENAEAKLKGLGHTAQDTAEIMDSALAAVKGTAFGLDEAASIAATATAAGVESGRELESTLRLVADTAAITGSDLASMGDIFNKVAAQQALDTRTMQQLQTQGIPVLIKIAEHYKVTAAEAQKMVTDGKIAFSDFAAVMQDTVGGSALKMGETTTGQLKNVGAALSRVGADVLGGLMPAVKTASDGLIGLADGWGRLPGPIKNATLALGAFIALERVGVFTKLASGATELGRQLRYVQLRGIEASGALSKVGGFLGKGGALVGGAFLVSEIASSFADAASNAREFQSAVDELQRLLLDAGGWDATIAKAREMEVIQSDLFKALVANGADYSEALRILVDGYVGATGATDSFKAAVAGLNVSLVEQFGLQVDVRRAAEDGAQAYILNTQALGSARTAMLEWQAAQVSATSAAEELAAAVRTQGASFRDYSDDAKLEARAVRGEFAQLEAEVTGSLDEIANAMAHQVDSMVSLHGAADDLGRSFAEFKGSLTGVNGELDLSSGSVRDLVTDMRAYGDAAQDAAAATYDQTGSLDAAAAVAAQARDEFIALMMSQGETRAEAERLATQMGILDSITINGKTFTITAIDNATPVLSRIAQLAAMLGITTANAGLSAGAAMSDWLRKNPTQINDAFQSAISNVKIDATATNTPGRSGGGGGGGRSGLDQAARDAEKRAKDLAKKINDILGTIGKPAPKLFDFDQVTLKSVLRDVRTARKAVADAVTDGLDEKAARQFRRQLKEMADTARHEFADFRIGTAADRVRDALAGVGRAPSKPFDLESVGADVLVGQLAAAGVELKKAIKAGLDKKQVKELRGELTEMSAEFGRQMQDVFTRIRTEGFAALQDSIDPVNGSVSAMRSAMGQLVDDLRTIGASDKTLGKMALLEGRLTHAMDQRAAVTEQLSQAQSELNRLMEQYQQRVDSVTDAFVSFASVTSMEARDRWGNDLPMEAMLAQMEDRAKISEKFAADIEKLRKSGLNETTLQELMLAGPGAGSAQASMLANASREEINKLNSLTQQVFGDGQKVGKMSADSMYGAGISAAQAMVRGLTEQQELLQTTIEGLAGDAEILAASEMEIQGKAAADGIIAGLNSKKSQLNKAIRSIGKEMIATFKAAMEIASPSKRMAREIGAPMGDGVIEGFVKTIGASSRMADSLPRIAVPAAAVGRSAGVAAAAGVGGVGGGKLVLEIITRGEGALTGAIADTSEIVVRDAMGQRLDVDVHRGRAGFRSGF